MKNSNVLLILSFAYLIYISNKIDCANQRSKIVQTNSQSTLEHLKALKYGQLISMLAIVHALEIKKRQEDDMRKKDLEMMRISEKNKEEMKRRLIIRTFLETRSGGTSVMRDIYTNRIF